jgi:solute:Na+ symporter, SSS family
VNALDYAVLFAAILGIACYGIWHSRGQRTLETYIKGRGKTRWFAIGLSVMATQASAVTFLSTPGQGYESGLGFVQIYFGMPIALIVIAIVFLPIYRRLNVYTAYEYLGRRFDKKTRLLGTAVFLLQRGLGAGITIYAPAIVLSTVLGWRLDVTIVCSGLVVIVYTALGGSEAVNVTQKHQFGVIIAGMIAAGIMLWTKLPADLTLNDTLTLAGGFHKLQAVDYSFDWQKRYTFWTGLLPATFLMLAYFGADQSQVQRYISGASLRESRLGLMFNAVCKIPMQFLILFLGVLLFVFYQFHQPPVYFNQVAWRNRMEQGNNSQLKELESKFQTAHDQQRRNLQAWIEARHSNNVQGESEARATAETTQQQLVDIHSQAVQAVDPRKKTSDSDFVFVTFILDHLPHGLIGLLIAAFFAAALSSKAAELSALASTTTVDLYRHVINPTASDGNCLRVSKWFTVLWGVISVSFALSAALAENLIQAVNIVGSIFYPVMLGLFMMGFFLPWIRGTAAFWGGLAAQLLVIVLYFSLDISYLWYNLIGCVSCIFLGVLLQSVASITAHPASSAPTE